jgi:lysophospholipase L1-like esterase
MPANPNAYNATVLPRIQARPGDRLVTRYVQASDTTETVVVRPKANGFAAYDANGQEVSLTAEEMAAAIGGSAARVVSANTTAANDERLNVVASATITDPSPVEGKGYVVAVVNGTATVNGTGYSTAGTIIERVFHSGSWRTEVYLDSTQVIPASEKGAANGVAPLGADSKVPAGYLPASTTPAATTSALGTVTLSTVAAQRLAKWYRGGVAGKKIVMIGDSTAGAVSADIWGFLNSHANHRVGVGAPLAGTIVVNLAGSGQSAQGIRSALESNSVLSGGGKYDADGTYTPYGTYSSNPLTEAADLYIVNPAINDVRLGARTATQLRDDLMAIVNIIRAAVPQACVILRNPNPLLPINDGYVSPHTSAQDYTDRMRQAYDELADLWPDVVMVDVMRSLFFTTSPASAAPLYSDSIHPGGAYDRIFQLIGNVITPPSFWTAAPTLTAKAFAASATQPWTNEPRVLLDSRFFEVFDTGYIGTEWVNGNSFARVTSDNGGGIASRLAVGDVLWVPGYAPVQFSGAPSRLDATRWQVNQSITATLPTSARYAVYRQRFMGDSNIEAYSKDLTQFPYRFRARVSAAGSGFIRFNPTFPSLDEYQMIDSTCTLVVVGQSPISLSGWTITAETGAGTGFVQVSSGATDYSALAGRECMVFGSDRQASRTSGARAFGRNGDIWINGSNLPQMHINGSTRALIAALTNFRATLTGTAYTTTTGGGLVVGGTTSPTITLSTAGTYSIRARLHLRANAATITNQTLALHTYRQNNSPTFLASTTVTLPPMTIGTQSILVLTMEELVYASSATSDIITLYAQLSGALGAGTVEIVEASVTAVRLF